MCVPHIVFIGKMLRRRRLWYRILLMKRKRIILVASILAALAAFFAVFGVRQYHRRHYDYIDLPIVLSNEEEVVKTIRDGMTAREKQVNIEFTAKGDYSEYIVSLADSLVDKALGVTDDPKQGDYLRFQYGGFRVNYGKSLNSEGKYNYTIYILPTYYTTLAKEESVDEAVSAFLSENGFSKKTTDEEKIKAAHDYLAAGCEYDWRNSLLIHRHNKSTAYGALVSGEASCQGYSVAMYRLLMEAGVKCRVITGYATSPETGEREYHAWNLVCIDGKWYNVDVSWDDETDSSDYFLKSDASFSTHERDAEYDSEEFRNSHPSADEDWRELPFSRQGNHHG